MGGNILETIALGEYGFSGTHVDLGNLDSAQLFIEASREAGKILGRSQDRDSKARLGSLLKTEGRKSSLSLDARRFTTAIPLGVLTPNDVELHSRVTVIEHFGRRQPQKRFISENYAAIAVKLFVMAPDEHEEELHLALSQVSKKNTDDILTHINGAQVQQEQGVYHLLELLELTHIALD